MKPYDTSWTAEKDAVHRDYTNIYVDNNAEDPIGDTIKLGYISNVNDVVFRAGEFSYFHFPLKDVSGGYNTFCNVSGTSIVDDGATCGSSPYRSDRIYKMRFGYEDTSPYGRSEPEITSNGKWLCSWLSGDVLNPTARPVWKDRWFDPKALTEQQALVAGSNGTSVYDTDSILSLDYGVYYKYWRVGNDTIRSIVDRIGIGDTLKIHHYNWEKDVSSVDGLKPKIEYINLNEQSLNRYRVSDDFDDGTYGITFNGQDQFAIVPYDDKVGHVTTMDYSIVFWVKCDSWKNATSTSIVDNMYAGGWRFGVTNRADTMFIFTYGNDDSNMLQNGTSCLLNQNGDLISTKAYWKVYDNPELCDMIMDIDGFAYVLDYDEKSSKTLLHKVDYYGNELGCLSVSDDLQYLDISDFDSKMQLVMYKVNGNAVTYYIVDKDKLTYVAGSDGTVINNSIVKLRIGTSYQYFCFDRSKCAITDNGDSTNDGDSLTNKLKYYSKEFLEGLLGIDDSDPEKDGVRSIVVDYDNNIWAVRSESIEKFSEIYHTYRYSKSYKIKKGLNPISIDILARRENGVNTDVLLVQSQDRHIIYAYSMDGEYIDSYDTSKFYVKPKGRHRCTMYDWYRMNKEKMTNCVYFDVVGRNGHNRIIKKLDECSDKEWHQMAAVVSRTGAENGSNTAVVEFYFDCKLVDRITGIPVDGYGMTTWYRYDSPIVLGGMCGKIHPIVDEINVVNGSFACTLDDFRIYNVAISPEDLYYIYIMKYSCSDLVWHLKGEEKNFVENAERFYKFKMPGSKSAQYVLHIRGYSDKNGEVDVKIKAMIEDMIHRAFKKITPSYTSLFKIVWD